MHPFTLLFWSSFVSLACLGVVLSVQNKLLGAIRGFQIGTLKQSVLTGFFNPFLYYTVLLTAYNHLPAQIAQPMNYTWPLVLVVLSAPLMKQKIKAVSLFALLISFCGVLIISFQGNFQGLTIQHPWAVLMAAGSSILWALYWLLQARDSRDETVKLFHAFSFGTIFTGILAFSTGNISLPLQLKSLSVIYVGLFEMGLTFVFWLKAMQLTDRNDSIGNMVYISPFMSLVFIHYILGESIFNTTWIGLSLILLGIFLQQFSRKMKRV